MVSGTLSALRNQAAVQTLHVEAVNTRDQFKHTRNIDFFEWWSQVNDGACPYRHQFDVVDHAALVPHLFVVRIESTNPWLYRFRLLGEDIISLLGRNDTGLSLSQTNWDSEDSLASKAYDTMMIKRTPLRFHGSLDIYGKSYVEFESIDAPFLGEDGIVNSVIGLICRL